MVRRVGLSVITLLLSSSLALAAGSAVKFIGPATARHKISVVVHERPGRTIESIWLSGHHQHLQAFTVKGSVEQQGLNGAQKTPVEYEGHIDMRAGLKPNQAVHLDPIIEPLAAPAP
jgi:hypothetical protein